MEGIEVIVGTYEELTLGYRLEKDLLENKVVFLCMKYVLFIN